MLISVGDHQLTFYEFLSTHLITHYEVIKKQPNKKKKSPSFVVFSLSQCLQHSTREQRAITINAGLTITLLPPALKIC